MKICPKCGTSYDDNMNYCNNCGSSLNYVAGGSEVLAKEDSTPKILGILSIVFAPSFLIGLILGIIGIKKSTNNTDKKLNKIGIILSIVALVVGLLILGFMIWFSFTFVDTVGKVTTGATEAIIGQ